MDSIIICFWFLKLGLMVVHLLAKVQVGDLGRIREAA